MHHQAPRFLVRNATRQEGEEKRQPHPGSGANPDGTVELLSWGVETAVDGICALASSAFSVLGDMG